MPRPRVLDAAKCGHISALIAAGCGINDVARYIGCSANTIRREALRNEDFRRQLRGAEVQMQLDPLRAMRQAAATHWRAAAWLLERTNPERFGRRRPADASPRQLHEALDAVIESAVEEIADPELRDRVCRRLMAVGARATRPLTSVVRTRLDPHAGPFDLPTTAEERRLNTLLAELDQSRASALQNLKGKTQNPPRCA